MKSFQHASMYAFAACIISIIISLGCFYAGLYMNWLNYLSYVAFIALTTMAVISWRKMTYGGYITYGKAFGHATYSALVFSIIMAIWAYIFFGYIGHDEILKMQSEQMAKQMSEMKTKYGMSDEQIQNAMSFGKKFMTPGFVASAALVMNMLFLTIINLVIAAFVKKDDPSLNTFDNNPYAQ